MVLATTQRTGDESRTVHSLDDLGLLANAWTQLQGRSPDATVFSTWQWIHAAARHFWRPDALRVTMLADGGDAIAIWPLARRRIAGCKGLVFLGSGPWDYGRADYQDALIKEGREVEACNALLSRLQTSAAEWDVVMLQDLPASSRLLAALPLVAGQYGWSVRIEPDNDVYRIVLPATWDEYASTLSSKMRSNLRQYQRKLARDHNARFERVEDPAHLAAGMDLLFDLHDHRWQEKRGSKAVRTIFSSGDSRAFHREVAHDMLRAGMLDLTLLRAGEETIGARYSFEYKGSRSYYASGYRTDGDWSKFSLGAVMDFHGIETSIEGGLQYEDFLRNEGGYKARYAPERLDNQRLFIFRTRSAQLRCETYYGLRKAAKRLLKRKSH